MPRSVYQRMRSSIQYWCHSSSVPGSTKNSISICSNSRVRKMKFPGVISLRNDLPICPIPNGGLRGELVRPVATMTGGALDQRVVERGHVTGGHPDLARQDHRRVQADHVVAALDHRLPPGALDVVLQVDTQRAVVPGGPGAAVDLAT